MQLAVEQLVFRDMPQRIEWRFDYGRPDVGPGSLVSRSKAVRLDCHARFRRNLDSMKDAVCLAQRHIADTLRSAHGFRVLSIVPIVPTKTAPAWFGHAQIVLPVQALTEGCLLCRRSLRPSRPARGRCRP
jgi:hypothetical protein